MIELEELELFLPADVHKTSRWCTLKAEAYSFAFLSHIPVNIAQVREKERIQKVYLANTGLC